MKPTLCIILLMICFLPNLMFAQCLTKEQSLGPVNNKVTTDMEKSNQPTLKYANGKVYIKWTVAAENADGIYIIERSADGVEFRELGFKYMSSSNLKSPCNQSLLYCMTDEIPLTGTSYYKFVSTNQSGATTSNSVVPITCPAILTTAYNSTIAK